MAARTLSRLGLLDGISVNPAFRRFRDGHEVVTVDGRDFYLVGGDMLADESELMLNWAVDTGLADAAAVGEAQRAIVEADPPDDVDFMD